jgi:hypothetical protein
MEIVMNTIVVPFPINSETLKGTYPNSESIKDVFCKANETERHGIIRLWITEGIPFAFKDNPLMYEEIREFIARGLAIHPKEVTLVGSARIGYSLKGKVWGKAFTNKSDLDFTVVSNELFKKLVSDFQKWCGDLSSKNANPNDKKQTENWLKSIVTVNENIPKGYINTRDIFSSKRYPTVKNCYRTMAMLQERLCATKNSPSVADASIRVYSNWGACIRQIKINFKTALDLWER